MALRHLAANDWVTDLEQVERASRAWCAAGRIAARSGAAATGFSEFLHAGDGDWLSITLGWDQPAWNAIYVTVPSSEGKGDVTTIADNRETSIR